MDLVERVELFRGALGFEGLADRQMEEIAEAAFPTRFAKGEIVFDQNNRCERFHAVASGLVKVSISSPSGLKITYLIIKVNVIIFAFSHRPSKEHKRDPVSYLHK
jgi:CRP-like cAMP-binding protein